MKKLLSLLLVLCMAFSVLPAFAYTAGTYTGEGTGNNQDVKIVVEVTFSEDEITDIKVVSHEETPGISDPAIASIPVAVIVSQSLSVDAVSGATNTSRGLLAAIEDAAVKAGADLDALKAAPPEKAAVEKAKVEQTTDVLVIGAGVAGMSAALAAGEKGLEVTVIEKMAAVGGTTNLAGGLLVCVDSDLFSGSRLDSDSLEAVLAYWKAHMARSGVDSGYPDWDRLENVLADTGKNVDWLIANGIEFDAAPYAGSSTYPMALAKGGGSGLASMLCSAMTEKGVSLITECKGTGLITDESGAVVGATAETADSEITFHAKAVILATGGISQNEELVARYSPKLHRAGLIPTSAVSHTGDGFLMALAAGAGTFDSFATPLFGTTVDPLFAQINPAAGGLSIYSQLGVNADGMRFGNEAASAGWDVMDYTASDMIQNGIAPFWYIYDSSDPAAAEILETGVADDVVAKGGTIEELALDMHVYTSVLKYTFDAYNEAAEAGEDAEFNKPAMFLKPLTQAPFYAVKVYPTTFGSAGGVTTTEQGRVTRQDGSVIPGLYAAGEMSNRYFYNENYILAASLGLYSTMGHRAGSAAAEDALAQ